MSGRPVFGGAVHATNTLVPSVFVTLDNVGARGGSSTSVTSIVTSMVALAVPSETLTVTE